MDATDDGGLGEPPEPVSAASPDAQPSMAPSASLDGSSADPAPAAAPRHAENPVFKRIKPEKWESIMRSDGRDCNVCVKIKKTSSRNLEMSRVLMVREPLLLMLNTEGKDEDMITRVLPITEIDRIVVYQQDGKVWIKAKEGTGSRDWIFRFEFDLKNTHEPVNYGRAILELIRDMRVPYVEWDPDFTGAPLQIEMTHQRSEMYLLGLEKRNTHPKTKTVREILQQLKTNMPKRFPPPLLPPEPEAPVPSAPEHDAAAAAAATARTHDASILETAPSILETTAQPSATLPPSQEPPLRDDEYDLVAQKDDNGGVGYGVAITQSPDKPVRVKYIVPGSTADEAGLEAKYPAEIITHINGQKVTSPEHVNQLMRDAIREGHGRLRVRMAPGDAALDTPEGSEEEEEDEYDDDDMNVLPQRSASRQQGPAGATQQELADYRNPFDASLDAGAVDWGHPHAQHPPPPPGPYGHLPPHYQQQPLGFPVEQGAEGPLSVPRNDRGASRSGRRRKDGFWGRFVRSYDAQKEHYARMEGELHRMVDERFEQNVVPYDFDDYEDFEVLAMRRHHAAQSLSPAPQFSSRGRGSPMLSTPAPIGTPLPSVGTYGSPARSASRVPRFHESPARSPALQRTPVRLPPSESTPPPYTDRPRLTAAQLRHLDV